ncbi:hypothetical protein D3C72_1803920 [compost metagenome]
MLNQSPTTAVVAVGQAVLIWSNTCVFFSGKVVVFEVTPCLSAQKPVNTDDQPGPLTVACLVPPASTLPWKAPPAISADIAGVCTQPAHWMASPRRPSMPISRMCLLPGTGLGTPSPAISA